jgi:MFS family permease
LKFKISKTFLGLSSFQILAMFRRGLFYTYLSIYFRDFLKLTVTETTLYATLPMIMSVVFQNFVWGPISDKFQRRRTLIILGETLAGIGTILVWLIHYHFSNLFVAGFILIIGMAIIEIFWSMSNIGWSALISDLYPSLHRSKVMGQLTSIGGIGRMIGISIGGLLYDNGFGFRDGPLFIASSLVMFISTLPMLFTPEGGVQIRVINDPEIKQVDKSTSNFKVIFWIFILSLLFINFGRNSITIPYPQYLTLSSGFNVNSILLSYIANTRSVAVLLIGYSAGFLSKRIGHSRTLILGTCLSIAAIVITALSPNLFLIFIGSFLLGTGDVIIIASSYALASDLIPAKIRAKLFGVYNTTFFLSWGIAGTLISAPVIDLLIYQGFSAVFAYVVSFLVGAIITGIGLLIFIGLEIILKIKKK